MKITAALIVGLLTGFVVGSVTMFKAAVSVAYQDPETWADRVDRGARKMGLK